MELPKFITNHILKWPRKSFLDTGFGFETERLKSTFDRILKTESDMRNGSLQLVWFTLALLALIRHDGAISEEFRLASSLLLIFSGLMPCIVFLIYFTEKKYLEKKRDWDEERANVFLNAQIKSGFWEIPWVVWEEFEWKLKELDTRKIPDPNKYWSWFLSISSILLWLLFLLGVSQLYIHF